MKLTEDQIGFVVNYFFKIPFEIKLEILSLLSDGEHAVFLSVCKEWNRLANDNFVWCLKYKNRFERIDDYYLTTDDKMALNTSSWKEKYIRLVNFTTYSWDPSNSSDFLRLTDKNLTVTNSLNDGGYGVAFANQPIRSSTFYWEHKIIDFGNQFHPGNDDQLFFGVGLKPPTGEKLHGDIRTKPQQCWCCLTTGKTSHMKQYGQPFKVGDTIGIYLNRKERWLAFYKNGVNMGVAFDNLPPYNVPLHPIVGVTYCNGKVTTNFDALCPDQ